MWSAANVLGIFKVAFKDEPQVDVLRQIPLLHLSFKNERLAPSGKNKSLLEKQTSTIFKSLAQSCKLSSAVFWYDWNQYCMNRAASLFPADHYSSPPQTADITHHHLANPPPLVWAASWPLQQLCLPTFGAASAPSLHPLHPPPPTPSDASSHSAPVRCNTSAEGSGSKRSSKASPGSNGSDFPSRGSEMGRPDPSSDLLHALIAAGLNRLLVNPGDRSPWVTPDLKSENRKTTIASYLLLSHSVM